MQKLDASHDEGKPGESIRSTLALVALLAAILLFASARLHKQAPPVLFTTQEVGLDGFSWLEEAAMEFGVALDLWGIYARDENRAFLFGGIRGQAGHIRPFLLRTDDGGEHWTEVMASVPVSVISEIVFADGGYGWALAMWTGEGPGPACVFRTADYGENWQKLSDIPYPGGHSITANLRFSDRQEGQVSIDRYMAGHWCILSTDDGGLTWRETGNCCSADECGIEWHGEASVLAQDGSRWRFEVHTYNEGQGVREIRISRQSSFEDTWIVVSSFPVHYQYKDGRLVLPELE